MARFTKGAVYSKIKYLAPRIKYYVFRLLLLPQHSSFSSTKQDFQNLINQLSILRLNYSTSVIKDEIYEHIYYNISKDILNQLNQAKQEYINEGYKCNLVINNAVTSRIDNFYRRLSIRLEQNLNYDTPDPIIIDDYLGIS